jgi:glycerol uptake facilitator protein
MKSMVAAEAFGTFVFTVLGCAANGARLYFSSNDNYAPFVWGAALTIGIYVSAALSGGHLNPAVTLSFALVRPADVRFRKLVPYWTAQVGGAAVAGGDWNV